MGEEERERERRRGKEECNEMPGCWVKVNELHQVFLNNHPVFSVNPIRLIQRKGSGGEKDMICCHGITA